LLVLRAPCPPADPAVGCACSCEMCPVSRNCTWSPARINSVSLARRRRPCGSATLRAHFFRTVCRAPGFVRNERKASVVWWPTNDGSYPILKIMISVLHGARWLGRGRRRFVRGSDGNGLYVPELSPGGSLVYGRRSPVRGIVPSGQAGFSLIEVMVTLVVLGIGMLGLAALQITGMRVNDGALIRTRAVIAAADLADRIRAQPAGFIGAGGKVSLAYDGCGENAPSCGDPVSCWQSDFCGRYQPDGGPQGLPAPPDGDTVSVDCTNAGGCGNGNCAITVRWSEERAGQNDPDAGEESEFRFCTRIPL